MYFWKLFSATAIDSRLEFKQKEPKRYTLLLGKGFPSVNAFTIAFWIRLSTNHSVSQNGTILSYKQGSTLNVIQMGVDDMLWFKLFGQERRTDIYLKDNGWNHVAWTWNAKGTISFIVNTRYTAPSFSLPHRISPWILRRHISLKFIYYYCSL